MGVLNEKRCKKIKITKIFGDVNAPLRALYYLTITTFYGCNG